LLPLNEQGLKKGEHDIGFWPQNETSLFIFSAFLSIFLLSSAHPPMIRNPKGKIRFNVEARAAKR
jgi:hypothetical protein